MRVAVTGGSGKLGRTVVRVLREAGNAVHVLDAVGERGPGFTQIDLTDYGQTVDALFGIDDRHDGLDAVVHLAAAPAGGVLADSQTFHNNMLATFNVFQGARRAGIKTIVYAASETLLGIPFDAPPPYIPVDEEYPSRPESVYCADQAPRGRVGVKTGALGPRAQHYGVALLQRHGRRRLRGVPGVRRRSACASGIRGGTSMLATAPKRSPRRSSCVSPGSTPTSSPLPTP